jgi:muramoyltetrapeptide carboxypeptidase
MMQNKRRNFLKMTAAGAGLAFSGSAFSQVKAPDKTIIKSSFPAGIKPAALKKGSRIALTAPASPTNLYETREGVRFFKSQGCEVIIGDTVKNQKNQYRYLSAPDEQRADELNKFLAADDIDCVFCARGGYGIMRILDKIDYNSILNKPKVIMGFSDITALINAINIRTGLVTFHGPVAATSFNAFTSNSITNYIFENPDFKPRLVSDPAVITVNEGTASGKLVGGNLTIIAHTLGTEYEIDTEGKILFLEDVSENGYEIDRMLTHLKLAGKLDSAAGIIFGYFSNLYSRRAFYPNKGYNILEVIEQIAGPTGKPCMVRLPFGHTKDKATFGIGVEAYIDTAKKSLYLTEKPVA